MSKDRQKHQIIIVGAGPIGLAAGIEATRRGLSHLIIDKGCLVNSIYHYPVNMTFFSTSDRLELGDVPFISHGVKPTRREALEYYRRVAEFWKLNVHTYEKVLGINGRQGDFRVETEKAGYRGECVIISTGYYDHPNLLNVPGEQLPKVKHYYDEPHPYAYQKVIVVGGGNSAVDVALETFRVGAEVTLVVRESQLKDSIKYWVKPDIENRIREGAIRAYFNSTVRAIRLDEVDIDTPEGRLTLKNDFVLAMTGYHPDYEFLQKIGVPIRQDEWLQPAFNPENFETPIAGIFLAGVACGGMDTAKWFIENSREHAPRIFDYIAERYISSESKTAARKIHER
ncbi:MAG: YpdA family putative bacillithiol disulfide reductase [Calditrichia bacterium]